MAALHALVERAYRGESARRGWTHEADLLQGQRTSEEELTKLVGGEDDCLLLLEDEGEVVGCVHVGRKPRGLGYLGLLSVDPERQGDGLGKRLMATAEREATRRFGAERMELTVLPQRVELIAYYQRRGYELTGERRPFPIALMPPFELLVLERRLDFLTAGLGPPAPAGPGGRPGLA